MRKSFEIPRVTGSRDIYFGIAVACSASTTSLRLTDCSAKFAI